jgi:5'-nucleotidase
MKKHIVYIDMDGVIVDFKNEIDLHFQNDKNLEINYRDNPDEIPAIFKNPQPVIGAVESIIILAEHERYDLFIATSATWCNVQSAMHKREWIEHHFGDLFKKK